MFSMMLNNDPNENIDNNINEKPNIITIKTFVFSSFGQAIFATVGSLEKTKNDIQIVNTTIPKNIINQLIASRNLNHYQIYSHCLS
jgi:hypothetical protein